MTRPTFHVERDVDGIPSRLLVVDKPKDQPWAPPHDETDPDSAPELRANTTDEADR